MIYTTVHVDMYVQTHVQNVIIAFEDDPGRLGQVLHQHGCDLTDQPTHAGTHYVGTHYVCEISNTASPQEQPIQFSSSTEWLLTSDQRWQDPTQKRYHHVLRWFARSCRRVSRNPISRDCPPWLCHVYQCQVNKTTWPSFLYIRGHYKWGWL